jgi:hypothetical protein
MEDKDTNYLPSPTSYPDNGWRQWSEWVKDGVRELRKEIKDLRSDLTQLQIDNKVQQVKVGVWGMIGSAIPIIISLALLWIKGKI